MLLRAVHALQPVYYGLFINVLIIRVYLIIQISLQVRAKAHFWMMTKCLDYAGVLIFKYPDYKVSMYIYL